MKKVINQRGTGYYYKVNSSDKIGVLRTPRKVDKRSLSSSTVSGRRKAIMVVKKWLGL